MVWSPCVDAIVLPSGEKATLIVETAGDDDADDDADEEDGLERC
jgi:hypothetical protein